MGTEEMKTVKSFRNLAVKRDDLNIMVEVY